MELIASLPLFRKRICLERQRIAAYAVVLALGSPMLSEATAKKVNRYFNKLVKSQPMWLKMLFEGERVAITINPGGVIGLDVDQVLDVEVKERIALQVARYINKHPAPFLAVKNIQ